MVYLFSNCKFSGMSGIEQIISVFISHFLRIFSAFAVTFTALLAFSSRRDNFLNAMRTLSQRAETVVSTR